LKMDLPIQYVVIRERERERADLLISKKKGRNELRQFVARIGSMEETQQAPRWLAAQSAQWR